MIEGVCQRRGGPRLLPSKGLEHEKDRDEDDVDQADGRFVEVVVVACDELPQLIDERAESYAPKNGGEPLGDPTQCGKQQEHGKSHEEAAPEHVGDVQSATAQLRVAGGGEGSPDHQYRGYARDEEELDEFRGIAVADEVVSDLHEASSVGAVPGGRVWLGAGSRGLPTR